MGWAGAKNGILLQLAADCHFDAFITVDQSMEYQQNVDTLPIAVVIMIATFTRLEELRFLVPKVVDILNNSLQHRFYRVVG